MLEFENIGRLPLALRVSDPCIKFHLTHLYPILKDMPFSRTTAHHAWDHLELIAETLSHNANNRNPLLIPVFYANLRLPHSVHDPMAALTFDSSEIPSDQLRRVMACTQAVILIPRLPESALRDIWPRFWYWFQMSYHCLSPSSRREATPPLFGPVFGAGV